MKQLICEMCGSTDLVKQDGLFACQSCGTKYSVEEAKKMMVEGTVEVVGTVSVDKSSEIESLHKRMIQFLEDAARERDRSDDILTSKEFEKGARATEYADRILDIDSENAPAYIVKFLRSMRLSTEEEIANCNEYDLMENEHLQKALRFADPVYRERIEGLISEAQTKYREAVARLTPIREALPKGRIATSSTKVVGVRKDGTVAFFGGRYPKYSNTLNSWRGIVAVATSDQHTVGLKADGTVVAVCDDTYTVTDNVCNVGDWRDIVAVAVGDRHTVGLKADGTVVRVGDICYHQPGDWRDIIAVAASDGCTYGLKADGTVVGVGWMSSDDFSETRYPDIVAVAAKQLMLRADGRVTSWDKALRGWRDIISVAGNHSMLAGLKADGTVVSAASRDLVKECAQRISQEVGTWKDIVAISASLTNIVGLKRDGTVVQSLGRNMAGEAGVTAWRDMAVCSDEELRANIRKAAEAEEAAAQRSAQWASQGLCRYCGGQMTGLFRKKCKSCGQLN